MGGGDRPDDEGALLSPSEIGALLGRDRTPAAAAEVGSHARRVGEHRGIEGGRPPAVAVTDRHWLQALHQRGRRLALEYSLRQGTAPPGGAATEPVRETHEAFAAAFPAEASYFGVTWEALGEVSGLTLYGPAPPVAGVGGPPRWLGDVTRYLLEGLIGARDTGTLTLAPRDHPLLYQIAAPLHPIYRLPWPLAIEGLDRRIELVFSATGFRQLVRRATRRPWHKAVGETSGTGSSLPAVEVALEQHVDRALPLGRLETLQRGTRLRLTPDGAVDAARLVLAGRPLLRGRLRTGGGGRIFLVEGRFVEE